MCGIWGFLGRSLLTREVFLGLKKLEYRGYDSAGIAVLNDKGQTKLVKAAGKLKALEGKLSSLPSETSCALSHTRWATHGEASEANAHPHYFAGFSLVHNGIIENYEELKSELPSGGLELLSQTDSEVILHLLAGAYEKEKDIKKALIKVAAKLKGSYALALTSEAQEDEVYLLKKGSPLVLGLSKERQFFSSDPISLLKFTQDFIYLEDEDLACLRPSGVEIFDAKLNPVARKSSYHGLTPTPKWNLLFVITPNVVTNFAVVTACLGASL